MIVIGGGGYAREVAVLVRIAWGFDGFVLDGDDRQCSGMAAIGAGTPQTRARIAARPEYSDAIFPALIHPGAVWEGTIGDGCVVLAGAVVAHGVQAGKFCLFNKNCSVGHSNIGDFVTISPCAAIGGGVVIGNGVSVGAGAVVLPNIVLGPDCVVGAGAVVTKDVAAGVTVVGNPARVV